MGGGGGAVAGGMLTPRERELKQRVDNFEHRLQRLERVIDDLKNEVRRGTHGKSQQDDRIEGLKRETAQLRADVSRLERDQQRRR
jgi:chromosome segregation ATPase